MAWSEYIPYWNWSQINKIGFNQDPQYQFMITFLLFMVFFFTVAALVEKKKPKYGH